LQAVIARLLTAVGLPEADAAICAARMIEADLHGVDTHEIFRLPPYCQRIRAVGIRFALDTLRPDTV
jgi:LDH2 family malate/lactate/ureidoglycolate dehydrogenase